ncbi:VRR-NUC domain-containing protein [Photobacterium galatheae]|nr:VRR-NUC domain-containing protein [Photobacterium galatheae]MCM0148044.1 VRR-NUC domain-containing protein [Photobacterium galatheae]
MTQSPPAVLATEYYRENFELLLDTVHQQYRDLLSQSERHWVATYHDLPVSARLLYIRLLSRKGQFFRISKLHYAEISPMHLAVQALDACGFITINRADWPMPELLSLFTKPELLSQYHAKAYPELWAKNSALKQARKPELIEALLSANLSMLSLQETIVHVEHQAHLNTFLLLFFGNQHQDLSQFVLADLGLHQFECYQTDTSTRLFQQRHHILQWLSLEALARQYEDSFGHKNSQNGRENITREQFARNLPKTLHWQPLERRRQRLLNRIGRDLERQGRDDLALYLYRQSTLPPSRERQVRILDRLNRHQTALALSETMQRLPYNEEEREVGQRLNIKLRRTLALPYEPPAKDCFTEDTLTLPATGQRVELAVAEHYQQQGWHVYYTENALLCGLFGLAFWDIIFAPVPGAFLNPFQRAPRDMYHSEFCERRQPQLSARLEAIRSARWHDWLTVFEQKSGLSNDWVNWSLLSPDLIRQTVQCLTGEQLYAILSRLLFDPRHNRSGQPDLVMFKQGNIKWVEVKGPGDTLQANQKRWLRLFRQLDLDASINHVRWQM